jgi:hypothetical protein
MKQYHDLLRDVLENGESRGDRTGTGTLSVFGRQARYDLREGFPCLTTKKLHLRSIIHELLWFLKGDTNISYLQENGVKIWDEWADENGDLGPVYGQQWRAWAKDDGTVVDQIARLLDDLKHNPTSRRHLVSAWNVCPQMTAALAIRSADLTANASNARATPTAAPANPTASTGSARHARSIRSVARARSATLTKASVRFASPKRTADAVAIRLPATTANAA